MNFRTIAVVGGLLVAGGVVLWDYYTPDSRRARELHDLEKLAPDAAVPECFPKHPQAKVFAGMVHVDKRPPNSVSQAARRSQLDSDCIRGTNQKGNVEQLAAWMGDDGPPLFAAVIEGCPVGKTDLSPPACFALDALFKLQTPKATAALENVLAARKAARPVLLGALLRLLNTPGWRTRVQLAEMVPSDKSWEAKELIIEKIREQRDPSARPALQKALEAETDASAKGKLQAALLEIDNPGKCVAEDSGAGASGKCRYVCKDQNMRLEAPKVGSSCPLVRDPQGAGAEVAKSTAK